MNKSKVIPISRFDANANRICRVKRGDDTRRGYTRDDILRSVTDIESIAGVLVWTSSDGFEEMAEFYVDVLGLRPRSRRPGVVNFEWGTRRLTVAVHSEVTGMSADPNRIMINLTVSRCTYLSTNYRSTARTG